MKDVKDRVVQYPNRFRLTSATTRDVLGEFDLQAIQGTVQEQGTPINKELFDSIRSDLETNASAIETAKTELTSTINSTQSALQTSIATKANQSSLNATNGRVSTLETNSATKTELSSARNTLQGNINALSTSLGNGTKVVHSATNSTYCATATNYATSGGIKNKFDNVDNNITALQNDKVDKTTTVNGHALSGNISVTKSDVGLGNVTNESKTTMFTSPNFTGTPTISNKAIATQEYVNTLSTSLDNGTKIVKIASNYASGGTIESSLNGKANTSDFNTLIERVTALENYNQARRKIYDIVFPNLNMYRISDYRGVYSWYLFAGRGLQHNIGTEFNINYVNAHIICLNNKYIFTSSPRIYKSNNNWYCAFDVLYIYGSTNSPENFGEFDFRLIVEY